MKHKSTEHRGGVQVSSLSLLVLICTRVSDGKRDGAMSAFRVCVVVESVMCLRFKGN